MALSNEVTRSESILVSVTAGKTLVGHIEESEVALLLEDIADLAPLLLSRVNTSGVVCTSVEKNNGLLRDVLEKSMRIYYEEDVIL